MVTRARITTSGGTQTLQLPEGFGFDTDEVCLKRIGSALVLFPKDAAWDLLAEALGKADDDFLPDRDQGEPERRKAV